MFNNCRVMLISLERILRNTKLSPISWLIGLSGIMVVRFFLEAISNPSSSGVVASDASTLIHYYSFFVCFALGALIFFHFAIPKWKDLAPQIVLFLFLTTLLGPIIDFCISLGAGSKMTYLFLSFKSFFYYFITFFGPSGNGITVGIRVEVLIILLFSSCIIFGIQKTQMRATKLWVEKIVSTVVF